MPSNNPITAYVSLGSNLGDRAGNLLLGIRGMLDAGHEVTRLSQIYETEPVGTLAQPIFLNMVAELGVEARLKPEELLEQLLGIEQLLGRTRDSTKGPRTIDLDLLLYGEELVNNQRLTLPHPQLHRRRFVLVPLTELCPNLEHPVIHRTIAELLRETTDRSEVKPWIP
jgi:2-amino-4-hydroxy-6-hydroxymethyldihydropteridine diphosphokinase